MYRYCIGLCIGAASLQGVESSVSPALKEMVARAQKELGVTLSQQVPARPMALEEKSLGRATRKAIFINEAPLTQAAHGLQRFVVYHEAAHIKHGDLYSPVPHTSALTTLTAGFAGLLVGIWGACKGRFPTARLGLGATTISWGIYTQQVFSQEKECSYDKEKRADQTAAYALKCGPCVREAAEYHPRQDPNNAYLQQGYLSREALDAIAHEHECQRLLCSYHQEKVE